MCERVAPKAQFGGRRGPLPSAKGVFAFRKA
jgi:hypothetical protein